MKGIKIVGASHVEFLSKLNEEIMKSFSIPKDKLIGGERTGIQALLDDVPVRMYPDELIVPKRSFASVIWDMNKNRKCYNARQSMTLKQFKKFVKKKV